MASIPFQPPSQRWYFSTEQSSPIQETLEPTPHTDAMNTESTQTALPQHSSDNQQKSPPVQESVIGEAEVPSKLVEPRHCWICLQDEGDEGSEKNGEWRSPCPCNLQAHEGCMLEWIADLEAPNSGKRRPVTKILCPQCKAEINVGRPADPILSTIELIRTVGRTLVLPAGLCAICGCLCAGSMAYGINAIHLVGGADVDWMGEQPRAFHLLSAWQALQGDRIYGAFKRLLRYTDPFTPIYHSTPPNWPLLVAAPLIGPALILSRTTLADPFFAVLPLLFITLRPPHGKIMQWPPSPITVFALLPYLRTTYHELYKNLFANAEKKWDRAVMRKPRDGETAEQVARDQNEAEAQGDGILQLQVEINIGGHPEEQPAIPQIIDAPPVGQADRGGQPDQDAALWPVNNAEEQQVQEPNGVPGQGQEQGLNGDRDNVEIRRYSPFDMATSVMGALFFPAVSSLMGDLLKYSLPKRLVTKPIKKFVATGILQEKWGRSFVGGCLFVVLKDMAMLYAKWRKAQNVGKRRVVDFVK